jgi:DNA-directed RNA polymerase subunit RPC12/RpoP
MALIKCHECGNQVSDNAVACPKCGAPVMVHLRRRQKAYLIRLGISLLFAAIVIFFVFRMMNKLKEQVIAPLNHQTTR